MNQRRWMKPILFSLVAAVTLFGGGAQAGPSDPSSGDRPSLNTATLKTAKVGGKWRIAWDVRGGTARGILDLKQHADQVTGTFEEYLPAQPTGRFVAYSLTGSLQGQAITFDVPFTGPVPYTIEFKGTIERGKMSGTSGLKGGGKVFLGHAGEVDEPQRPWIATKGLKRQPDSPHAPPKEDDD